MTGAVLRGEVVPLYLVVVAALVAVGWAERRQRAVVATVGPTPPTVTVDARTLGALARIELGRLARHPLLLLGLLATVALFAGAGGRDALRQDPWMVTGLGMSPLLAAALVTLHLAVSRERRARTEELLATLPTGPSGRTLGHQGAALALWALLASAWAAMALGWLGIGDPLRIEHGNGASTVWEPGALELVQPVLAVGLVLALAIAAGRWWPHAATGPVLALLLFFSPFMWGVPLTLSGGEHVHWETGEFLGVIGTRELAWHLGFLGGVLALATAGALARADRRVGVRLVVAVAVVAAVTAGIARFPTWYVG